MSIGCLQLSMYSGARLPKFDIQNVNTMKEINTGIEIKGSASQVWNALLQKGNTTWNPFIQKLEGTISEGSTIHITLKVSDSNTMQLSPKVLKLETNREFRWLGHLYFRGLFDGEHYFIIHDRGPNQVYFEHGERFTGILAGLIFKLIGQDTRGSFIKMNRALKEYVENASI